jgi:predicted transcriptional regulator
MLKKGQLYKMSDDAFLHILGDALKGTRKLRFIFITSDGLLFGQEKVETEALIKAIVGNKKGHDVGE